MSDINMNSAIVRQRSGMTELSNMHEQISQLLPKNGKVVYLDYAFTTNVGDQLIVLGTLEFFRRYGIEIKLARCIHNIDDGGISIGKGDVLVFHGGGNFGDIYPHFQSLREKLISSHLNNKVVILPQTVHFSDQRKLDTSCRLLAGHPDITLFVRDKRSLALVAPYFGERAKLSPDMAHQLWPSLCDELAEDDQKMGKNPLFLIRRDEEKVETPSNIAKYSQQFTDWDSLTSLRFKIERKLIRWQHPLARRGLSPIDVDQAYFSSMRGEILRTAQSLSRYPVWVTSRMHGAILGLLLEKPVFALDNSYGKLSSYFEAWKEWISPISLVKSSDEAESLVSFIEATRGYRRDALWQAYRNHCAKP
jgi:pyruvyl transferase EpsO